MFTKLKSMSILSFLFFLEVFMTKLAIAVVCTFVLTACGGGGSVGSVGDVPGIKAPSAVSAVSAN